MSNSKKTREARRRAQSVRTPASSSGARPGCEALRESVIRAQLARRHADVRAVKPARFRLKSKPVEIRRRLLKQRGLLSFAVGRGDTLERVEDHLIAALALVRRKVAFEHAAFGTERLDAALDIGTPGRGGVFRRWRPRTFVEIVAQWPHCEAAEFHHDIAAFGEFADLCLPDREDLLPPVRVAADADRSAAM